MLGAYDLRDLAQERIKYPALKGQHPSRYPVPGYRVVYIPQEHIVAKLHK